ncbi:MAG: hypothetical protein ACOYJI_01020 [Anaerovoracaceae bacterium]|jgi:ABC-2 type transport system permease protein
MKKSTASSHSPAAHDFRLALKSLIPVIAVALVIFAALIPVSTAAIPDSSIFNINYTHEQLKFRFCSENTIPFVCAAALLTGAAIGLRLFSFMQDRRRSAFYFSLGIPRSRLYITRAGAGLIAVLITAVIPSVISLILNIRALGAYDSIYKYFIMFTLALVLQEIAGMMLGAAGCFLSGTSGESVAAALTLGAAPTVAIYLANVLMKTFTWGSVYGAVKYSGEAVKEGLLTSLSDFNPAFFSYGWLQDYNSFSRTMDTMDPDPVNAAPVAAWFAVLAVVFVLLGILFDRYKAERSGLSGLFKFTNILALIVWPAASFAVVLDVLKNTGTAISTAAAVCCMILVYAVLAGAVFLRNGTFKSRTLGCVALCAVVFVCLGTAASGGFGLSYRIPDVSDVESVEISYTGDPSLIPGECSIIQNGNSLYYSGTVELSSDDAIETAEELDKTMIERGREDLKSADDFGGTVLPYDIEIRYKTSSGTIERYYDRVRASDLAEFLKLEDGSELMNMISSVVKGDKSDSLWNSEAFASGEIYVSNSYMTDVRHITLTQENRDLLLQSIASDLSEISADSRYHPQSDQTGFIYFTLNGESDTEQFAVGSASTKVYLTDEFTATNALLASWNALPDSTAIDAQQVDSIMIQKFDPYSGMNELSSPISLFFSEYRSESSDEFLTGSDFGTRPQITDKDQISQLLSASVSSAYMDDGGCLIAVKPAGSTYYIYRYIPLDSEPDFIKEKIN